MPKWDVELDSQYAIEAETEEQAIAIALEQACQNAIALRADAEGDDDEEKP